jgi:hypothetical protein
VAGADPSQTVTKSLLGLIDQPETNKSRKQGKDKNKSYPNHEEKLGDRQRF